MNSATPGISDAIENDLSSAQAQDTNSNSRRNRRERSSRSVSGIYIAAMVVGFVFFWPIGLAMLAWALWRDQIKANPMVQKFMQGSMPTPPSMPNLGGLMGRKSSNTALAEYLEQEQSRLKAEQHKLDELVKAFEAFKQAERQTADQRDFEEFLRRREGSGDTPTSG